MSIIPGPNDCQQCGNPNGETCRYCHPKSRLSPPETIDVRERFLALSEALPESSIAGCAARWVVALLDERDAIQDIVKVGVNETPMDQAHTLRALLATLQELPSSGDREGTTPPPSLSDGMYVLTLSRDAIARIDRALGDSVDSGDVTLAKRIFEQTKPPPVYTLRDHTVYKRGEPHFLIHAQSRSISQKEGDATRNAIVKMLNETPEA